MVFQDIQVCLSVPEVDDISMEAQHSRQMLCFSSQTLMSRIGLDVQQFSWLPGLRMTYTEDSGFMATSSPSH